MPYIGEFLLLALEDADLDKRFVSSLELAKKYSTDESPSFINGISLASLKGNISDQTALGLMSFIDNPEYELELMEKEKDSIEPIELGFEEEPTEEENNIVSGNSDPTDLFGKPEEEKGM